MRGNIFKKGISLIEVVLAVAIISGSIIFVAQAYGSFVSASTGNVAKVQATLLLDEGVEAVKTIRGEKWSNIASTTNYIPYYLVWDMNSNKWQATTTQQVVDNLFYRTMVFEPVTRDAGFNILAATTTGTLDSGTKKVNLSVAWREKGATTTRTITMYIFNLFY